MESSAFDRLMNDPEISEIVRQRIKDLKVSRRLSDDDDLLFYLAEFGFVHRLFEDVPRLIKEAAKAECDLLREELRIINVSAKISLGETATAAADKVNNAAKNAEIVAGSAVEKAAGELVRKVSKQINSTIATQAKAALWRERFTTVTFALVMVSFASTAAWLLSPYAPDSAIAQVKQYQIQVILRGLWHAPAGWLFTITASSALVAFLVEIGGAQFKEWLKNRFNNRGY